MPYDIIKKNVYFDPPSEYPHTSRNHAEDFQDYHLPLARLHHAAMHGRGIAAGLELTGAAGAVAVGVNAGVCVDGLGQMIVLSTTGQGDIGANPPAGTNNPQPVPVQVPLASQSGKKVYVTIQFSNINRVGEGSGGRLEQVPWIRLQPSSGAGAYVDDGSSVILGIVDITAAGLINTLAATDGALPYGRHASGLPASEIRIQRSVTAGTQADETLSGRLSAGSAGGLQLTVPNSGDSVVISQDGGTHCASVETRADTAIWKDSSGRDVVHIDSNNAWMRIGASGNEGDLVVQTGSGATGLAFDGSACRLDIGGPGSAGHLYMRNAAAGLTAHLDGSTGAVHSNTLATFGTSPTIDVNASFLHFHGADFCIDGRSGGNKRALVDWGNELIINFANDYANGVVVGGILKDNAGVPLMGNPVSKMETRWLYGNNGSQSVDIDLGISRPFTAIGTLVFINSTTDFDYDNAVFVDIPAIDGVPTGLNRFGGNLGPNGDPRNLRAVSVKSVGRFITVRVWAIGPDIEAQALGIVFYE
jgi:hypothetical protein